MSWNYRILELDDIDEGKYYELKEVYYDRDGSLRGYCDTSVSAGSVEGIIEVLNTMKEDAHRAILRPSDFEKKDGQ